MNERTVEKTRFFDAPRARVFEAWTKAEHLEHWFGPNGFTVHSAEADARAGGVFRLCMRSPDGKDYWVRGAYREVVAPERLVITCTAHDAEGVARLEEVINVSFADQDGKTKLMLNATARGASDIAATFLAGMEEGWAQTIDRLGTHLGSKTKR
jgi:uncharacterized protein YndB with AHSA1/START domain